MAFCHRELSATLRDDGRALAFSTLTKVRFGRMPKPARCKRALPGISARAPDLLSIAFLFLIVCVFGRETLGDEQPLAPATIVVFNSSVPESADLAKFYAQKRGIARDHLVGLACPVEEEISREDFDRTIANPLRDIFRERKWWTLREAPDERPLITANSIRFVALIKGMPLKIRVAENYPGDKKGEGPVAGRNDASVDSELSILGRISPEISGAALNPFFQSYRPVMEGRDPALLLVCRLDAPAAATVRRMIVDAIETEKTGLWGRAFVDGAHNTGGMEMGDRWLAEIVQQFHKAGVPVVYDDAPEVFPTGFPISDCALYYGWYAANATGPFAGPEFRFTPGSVAVHIHSFSASTLRDPNAGWVGPVVTKGAAVSLGNVYEPYLQLTTRLDIFNDRLLHGFTFAESAYMGTQALSWMSIMVGDPLYRPYASWLKIEATAEPVKSASEWKMYRDFAVQNSARPAAEFRTLARQAASRARNGAMIEDLGLMEARDGNHASATNHFQQARTIYAKRDDILRVVLAEAESWARQDKPKRAVELVRSVLKIVPDTPSAALLRKIEQDFGPKAPAPKQ